MNNINKIYNIFNNVLVNIVSILPLNLPRVIAATFLKIFCLCSTFYLDLLVVTTIIKMLKPYTHRIKSVKKADIFFEFLYVFMMLFLVATIDKVLFFDFNSIMFISPENFPEASNLSFETDLNNLSAPQQKEFEIQEETKNDKNFFYYLLFTTTTVLVVCCVAYTGFKP